MWHLQLERSRREYNTLAKLIPGIIDGDLTLTGAAVGTQTPEILTWEGDMSTTSSMFVQTASSVIFGRLHWSSGLGSQFHFRGSDCYWSSTKSTTKPNREEQCPVPHSVLVVCAHLAGLGIIAQPRFDELTAARET